MKIVSINVNGIRSAAKKGVFDWLNNCSPDIICMQEVRADPKELVDVVFNPVGYHIYHAAAIKKGYSGVAIYSKKSPKSVSTSLDCILSTDEGRFVQIEFNNLSVVSLYLPSGTREERQKLKYTFLDQYFVVLEKIIKSKKPYIITGDWNIAHHNIDIKNWRANQNVSGFLPEERAWLSAVLELGFVDSFRYLYPTKEQYTWWSNFGKAYVNNVGWRIDYQIITPNLVTVLKDAYVYTQEKFSDHAPVICEYDLVLT